MKNKILMGIGVWMILTVSYTMIVMISEELNINPIHLIAIWSIVIATIVILRIEKEKEVI